MHNFNLIYMLVEMLFGFLSSVGFGVLTNIPKRILLPAGITGATSWGVYCLYGFSGHSTLWQNLLASIVIAYMGSFFAKRYKTPATMIYIPSLVSLVPGGLAAVSMKDFTLGHVKEAGAQIQSVFLVSIALAVGFVIGEALFRATTYRIKRSKEKD